jgi:hypothetical protein
MKKLVIILLLLLMVSLLFASAYKAQVSTSATAAVTEPQAAKLGYKVPPGQVTLIEGKEKTKLSFILYNRFPLPATVNVSGVVSPSAGLTVAPLIGITVPPNACPIHITYTPTAAGNYTVTYLVVADIISSGSHAHVELTIYVPVTVKAKPTLDLPPPPPPPESQ